MSKKLIIASVYLDCPAILWFQWADNNQNLRSLANFRELLLQRFDPSPFRDLRWELAEMLQTTTVQQFYNDFEPLANQIFVIYEECLQTYFEFRLRRDIGHEVRAMQPPSLRHALQFAQLHEDRLNDMVSRVPQAFYSSSARTALLPTRRRDLDPKPPNPLPIHRLSQTQIVERRAKGLVSIVQKNGKEVMYVAHNN